MELTQTKKKWFYFILAATFVWGLWAHGYGFLQSSFSHDSLNEFNGADGGNAWKIQLGRVIVPIYRTVFRSDLTLPWMVGTLSLLWIALAVYLTVKMFRVESKILAVLFAGVFVTNISVTATAATYLHDFDCNMFGLLCAVAAAYCWKENGGKGKILGALFAAFSMGIYQSYLCVTVALVIFDCLLELMNEKRFGQVFLNGIKAVGMILLGGVVYFAMMKLILAVTGIPLASGENNNLDIILTLTPGDLIYFLVYTYIDFAARLLHPVSPYPAGMVSAATILLLGIAAAAVWKGLFSKNTGWLEKLLILALLAVLPLGMNLMYVLTCGVVHDLMVYAIWLVYVLALLLADWLVKKLPWEKGRRAVTCASMALVFVLLYSNVQTANAVYLKKDLEQDAFISVMTRVLYRMEEVEEYHPGETEVLFVGVPEQLNEHIPGFDRYEAVTGAEYPYVTDLEVFTRAHRYFTYFLSSPTVVVQDHVRNELLQNPRIEQMPVYPEDGCTQMIDGILVVKLGES